MLRETLPECSVIPDLHVRAFVGQTGCRWISFEIYCEIRFSNLHMYVSPAKDTKQPCTGFGGIANFCPTSTPSAPR